MVTLSVVTVQSILASNGAEMYDVEEPQIAGVTDGDIRDESQPVAYEDTVDEGSEA